MLRDFHAYVKEVNQISIKANISDVYLYVCVCVCVYVCMCVRACSAFDK